MPRSLSKVDTPASRERVCQMVRSAPEGWLVEIREPRRSGPQNDRLWASLTDIAAQKTYHGLHLDPADWKLIFMDALSREMRIVPNLDGTGFVNLGQSSSKLTKGEFSDLLEIIYAWGAREGVTFHDQKTEAA